MNRRQRRSVLDRARFSPDGRLIATVAANGEARLWDGATGEPRSDTLPSPQPSSRGRTVAFSPTGERLLTRELQRARGWDSRTGRPLTEWMLHSKSIQTAQFSPDGGSVLTTSADQTVTLWDIRPAQALSIARRHFTLAPSARFNRDGTRVVTASGGDVWRRKVRPFEAVVWDARTGELAGPRLTLSIQVQHAGFSPAGRRMVTACKDGEARVWEAQTGGATTAVMRSRAHVRSARFSLDGTKVVNASDDSTAQIWDAETGQPLTAGLKHIHIVRSTGRRAALRT
jgi:WD40 repeat protein